MPRICPRPLSIVLAVATLAACAEVPASNLGYVDGPEARFDPDDDDVYEAPWPGLWRTEGGQPRLQGFPNPEGYNLLDDYVTELQTRNGWGQNAPIYVRFRGDLDLALLPSPADSLDDDATVFLVNVDAEHPGYLERVPVQWEWFATGGNYQRTRLLAVAPVYGFPMSPGTDWALVVTRGAAGPSAAFQEWLDPAHPRHDTLAPLAEALPDLGLMPEDVAVASVVRTADPIAATAPFADAVLTTLDPVALDIPWSQADQGGEVTVYEGRVRVPNFQEGAKPYFTRGGRLSVDEAGVPVVVEQESVRVALSVPRGEPPAEGWPVVVYGHGTGGDHLSFARGLTSRLTIANMLAEAGFAGLGYEQPLHGSRGTITTDPELHTFNVLNPASATSVQRQGALEILAMVRGVQALDGPLTDVDGLSVPLDVERVSYLGHSQGGNEGAIAAPWLQGRVDAIVLSGAGGGLGDVILTRKNPMDFKELIEDSFGFDEGEELTSLHPLSGLLQHLVEITDPLVYGPHWFRDPLPEAEGATPMLLTSGAFDEQTPPTVAEFLATSAGLPAIEPVGFELATLPLRTGAAQPAGASSNLTTARGDLTTAGFSTWEDGDHFVLFRSYFASGMVQHFLQTARDGEAVVDPTRAR